MRAEQRDWVLRFQVAGRSQARYLWLLLVMGIFYLAVDAQLRSDPQVEVLSVPAIQLEIAATVVWASGPAVLAFILLAYMGAVRAATRASEVLGLGRRWRPHEAFDTAPNAIDLAVYTTKDSHWVVSTLLYFVHPTVLTVAWLEVYLLTLNVSVIPHDVPGRWGWVGAAGVLASCAAFHVYRTWRGRIRRTRDRYLKWRGE